MFVTVLGQKEASPWAIKQRRSLSFVLTLFLTLSRLVFLNRALGENGWKGTLASRPIICRDAESWKKAHSIVLHNSALVSPYIDQHENILRLKNPEQSEVWIKKEHDRTFSGWLQNHLTGR